MRFKMMAIVATALLVTPAFAQTEPVAPAASDAPVPKPKKEKKICRTEEALTGSNMPRVTCRTAAQWAKSDANGGDMDSSAGVRSVSGENMGR